MKHYAGILVLGLLSVQAWAATEQAPLTLQEAVNSALEKNKEVQASRNTVDSARFEMDASYGRLLPQVNVEGKYTVLNDPLDIELTDLRTAMISSAGAAAYGGAFAASGSAAVGSAARTSTMSGLSAQLPAFSSQIQKDRFWNATLSATQPLFTGGKILANIKAKRHGFYAAEALDQGTKDRIITEVVSRYYSVQLMKQIVDIKKEVLDGLSEHQRRAQALFKEGQLSKANLMRSDVAVAEAKREFVKAQSDMNLALILLGNTLGQEAARFDLKTGLFMSAPVAELESYLERAQKQNSNIVMLDHRKDQLDAKKTVAQANFLPTVALFGRYELYKDDLTALEPQWAVGVGAKINIFNGLTDFYDVKAVGREQITMDYYREHASELVKTEVRKFYHDLNSARDQYLSLETSRALADENLRLNGLSFREGVATALEVIDAQLALGKVKTEQSKAMYDYDVALVNLLRASGNASDILSVAK